MADFVSLGDNISINLDHITGVHKRSPNEFSLANSHYVYHVKTLDDYDTTQDFTRKIKRAEFVAVSLKLLRRVNY